MWMALSSRAAGPQTVKRKMWVAEKGQKRGDARLYLKPLEAYASCSAFSLSISETKRLAVVLSRRRLQNYTQAHDGKILLFRLLYPHHLCTCTREAGFPCVRRPNPFVVAERFVSVWATRTHSLILWTTITRKENKQHRWYETKISG